MTKWTAFAAVVVFAAGGRFAAAQEDAAAPPPPPPPPPSAPAFHPERFTDLGTPVRRNAVYTHLLGKDAQGRERYYQGYRGTPWFLLSIDPHTGEQKEFVAEGHNGTPWSMIWASNDKLYIGTGGGGADELFVFDPATEKLTFLGRPTTTEHVVWCLTEAEDGKVYGGTYPNAKLVSIDMRTHELKDLGRLSPDQMYIRTVDSKGPYVYGNAGPSRPSTWVYHTSTGEKKEILPDELRAGLRWGTAQKRGDGEVYFLNGKGDGAYRVDGLAVVPVDSAPGARQENHQGAAVNFPLTLTDGTVLRVNSQSGPERFFFRTRPGGKPERVPVNYGGTSTPLWALGDGPDGMIYGTTRTPITLFRIDPKHPTEADVFGDPSGRFGQVYGWTWHENRLYMAMYGGERLTVWDPKLPWNLGSTPTDSPRYLGDHGIGRPSSLVVAPDGRHLLAAGLPTYGQTGGVLTVIEPQAPTIDYIEGIAGSQSIVSMAILPGTDLVCLGTTWRGGSASEAKASEPRLLLWNTKTRSLESETPVPGEDSIVQMVVVDGLVYCTTSDKGWLVVFDPRARRIVHTTPLGHGPGSLFGLRHRREDGMLYALSGESILRIDPRTFTIERLGSYPGLDYGMALSDDSLFLCAGDRLVRFAIPPRTEASH